MRWWRCWGEERLLYKALKFDIGFIRGSYADENGNVTLEHECCTLEATSIAQAVKNSGGKVVVQVEKVVQHGDLDPKLVKIPGIYVDAIVVCENKEDHAQCQGCEYDGSMTGDFHVPLGSLEYPPMSAKKIIGRRAAMELQPDKVVNLGIGIPEYISMVANEEGIGDYMTLTVEAGPVGGVPQGGPKFGGSVNVEAILDQPYQFDFYDGGGVDLAFLGPGSGGQGRQHQRLQVRPPDRGLRRLRQHHPERQKGVLLRHLHRRRHQDPCGGRQAGH